MSIGRVDFTLVIHFTSDWHVGQGAGQPGHIDRLVRRDPVDDLPYVPAKTLTGIWRDACEAVAAGLDSGDRTQPWSRLVGVLFGEEPERRGRERSGESLAPARVAIRAARFPESLRRHLGQLRQEAHARRQLRQALTFVKPGVKIGNTGQAEEKYLRFEEVVRGGARLNATVTLDISGLNERGISVSKALLWAGARVVERIGGKRRRGLGRCAFELDGLVIDEAPALAVLRDATPQVPALDRRVVRAIDLSSGLSTSPASVEDWSCLPLSLHLQTPVVVPKDTLGNVVESLDFIPGTYLLGHITGALSPFLRADLGSLVARGDVQVSHAYVDCGGARGLPVPLSYHYDKEAGGLENGQRVWNCLVDDLPNDRQLKQHRAGYVALGQPGCLPQFEKLGLQITTHNTVDDEPQRPTEDVGGVYTYQAIPAGTILHATVRLRGTLTRNLPGEWWRSLGDTEVRLGIAKKDDYGSARIKCAAPKACPSPSKIGSEMIVWLLSDLLLRDDGLSPTNSVEALRRAFGPGLVLRDRAFLRTRRLEGWNVAWGLPRPSYVGLMAGSCAIFGVREDLTETEREALQARLHRVAISGLGERRAEGFGEIAFDHSLVAEKMCERSSADRRRPSGEEHPVVAPLITGADPVRDYARLIERSAWRQAIRRAAATVASSARTPGGRDRVRTDRLHWGGDRPSNSQLGALRTLASSVQSIDEARGSIEQWLVGIEGSENRKSDWPEAARKALRDLVGHEALVWAWLGLADAALPVMTAGADQGLKHELWPEAFRALLFAAIREEQREREARATRRRRQEATA